jgi:quinohemoprotein ethanol dehydrogenase
MIMKNRLFGSAMLVLLTIGLALPTVSAAPPKRGAAAVDQARLDKAASEPQNWMTYGGTYKEQRYVTLNQIKPDNVGKLGLAWGFQFDTNRGQEATPIVVDGTMYVSTAWSKVYALDARTGKKLWEYDPHVIGQFAVYACCDVVNRGVAVWKGKVFVGTMDGRLIAVNAATGKQMWSVQTTDRRQPLTISGAPRVFNDKVVIGNGGADLCCARGFVTAYDTNTGKQIWRFYTVPGDPSKGPDHAASDSIMAKAATTWFGKWWQYGGGGTVWDTIVYDKEENLLYFGVGNGTPWNRVVRSEGKGDNLFLGSIVAVDPDTGAYRWHYQESPGDSWDYTSTAPIMLATLPIDGQMRKVIMHSPKNGFFYIIDRKTGKLLSAKNIVPVTWATDIDLKTGRPNFTKDAYYEKATFVDLPSSLGAHSWHPMSYSPRTGLVYIPAMQRPAIYAQDPNFKLVDGRWAQAVGRPKVDNLPPVWGALIAWDPLKQKEMWRVPQGDMWNGGTLATATDLVFAGNGYGEFNAYSAVDGKKLWGFDAQTGVIAGPMSYSVGGEQYVAVLSGNGGAYGLAAKISGQPQRRQPAGRVLVFKLGATGKLPIDDVSLSPANPSTESFPPEQIAAGEKLYGNTCRICHGGHVLPDLRRSGALPSKDAWNGIVIGGALSSEGMASFSRWLKPEDAEAIRAYLNQEAIALRKTEGK